MGIQINGQTDTVTAIDGSLNVGGDVTIPGVLTYDDVTNIDSVGVVTARSDVSIADKIIHTGDTDTAIRFPSDNTFTVDTAGSEKLRITGIGSVGIGQHDPDTLLHLTKNNADPYNTPVTLLKLHNGGGNQGSTSRIELKTGAATCYIENYIGGANSNSGADLVFATPSSATVGSERVRITGGGAVQITNGNLVLSTSGTGIDFSANSNLTGMTGEVLDHYETGTYVPTWTNVVGNPTTYRNGIDNGTTSNGLSYLRVGKQVTVTGAAFWSTTNSSINNTRPNMSLPFQARTYSVSGTIANYSLGVTSEIHYLNYNSTTNINMFVMNSGGGHDPFGDNSTGELYFNITYMTY